MAAKPDDWEAESGSEARFSFGKGYITLRLLKCETRT